MADQTLTINLKLDKSIAEAASKAYFAGERQRQQKHLSDAEIAEKALTKTILREQKQRIDDLSKSIGTAKEIRLAAEKQVAAEEKAAAKESQRVAKEKVAADRQAAKEAEAAHREATKAALDAKKAAAAEEKRIASETAKLFAFIQKDNAKLAKQAATERAAADKKAFQDWKQLSDLQHKLAMKAWSEQQKSQEDNKSSLEGIAAGLGGVVAGFSALSVGKTIFSDLAKDAAAAHKQVAQYAEQFLKLRDASRELMSVMGKKPTSEATQEQLDFATKTGQTAEEARDFRLAFRGEAQQFKDRFAPGEFEKYEEQAAKLQVKENLTAEDAGKMSANAIRVMPKGKKNLSAKDIMNPLAKGFKVLQGGSGSNPVLANALARTIATNVGEDGMFGEGEGAMTDAAVALRVQAQYGAEEAAMHLENIQSGISGLDDNEQHTLGVHSGMDLYEAIGQIQKKHKASGKEMDKFLKDSGFGNIRTRRAIKTFINEGFNGGIVDKARKEAADFKMEDYEKDTDEFFSDPNQPGKLRVEQAKTRAKQAATAQNKVAIAPLAETVNRALEQTKLDPGAKFERKFYDWTTPTGWVRGMRGYEDPEDQMQYGGMVALQERRAKQAGIAVDSHLTHNAMGVPRYVEEGKTKTDEYLAKLGQAIEKQNALLEKANQQRDEGNKDRKAGAERRIPAGGGAPVMPPARAR